MPKKGGKKGAKKGKIKQDAFAKKSWFLVRAPNIFKNRDIGRTPVNKTAAGVTSASLLKGRCFETCLADLNQDEDQYYRKIKFVVEDTKDGVCFTDFHSMRLTTDKRKGIVRKWHSLFEAVTDVRTADGYLVRLFVIAQTQRRPNQVRKRCYAKTSQIKRIRKKMVDIMVRESVSCDIKQLFEKFFPESIGLQIERECQGIFPLKNVYVYKCKILSKPKVDQLRLRELHGKLKPKTSQGDGQPQPEMEDVGTEVVEVEDKPMVGGEKE